MPSSGKEPPELALVCPHARLQLSQGLLEGWTGTSPMAWGAPSSPSLSGGGAGSSGWMRRSPQAHLTRELCLVSISSPSQGCSPALAEEPW